jgi:hypothetical protein
MLDIDLTALPGEVAKGHCDYCQEDRIRRDIESYFGDCARLPAPPPARELIGPRSGSNRHACYHC